MFGSSSQLPTTPEHAVIKPSSTDQTTVLDSGQKLRGAAQHLINGSKERI